LSQQEEFMQDHEPRAMVESKEVQEGTTEKLDAANDQRAAEVVPSLEEMLKKAELDAQEHHDAWLRAKAETENVRKRAQTEVANAHKFATEAFASDLLPVRDSLEAALAAGSVTLESLKAGVELTLKQLDSAFERSDLKEINPLGEKLDPHKHQAMNVVESDAAPNTVVAVLQKGYQLHDRVIRPALVSVARGKEA
jgi:molecular chaperone GrpE